MRRHAERSATRRTLPAERGAGVPRAAQAQLVPIPVPGLVVRRWFDEKGKDHGDTPIPSGWIHFPEASGPGHYRPPQDRQDTHKRGAYFEGKWSEETKQLAVLLGCSLEDMVKSSPHMKVGTGQGGAEDHKIRDGKVMHAIIEQLLDLAGKKLKGVRPSNPGDALRNLKSMNKPTVEELKERKELSKDDTRGSDFREQQERQRIAKLKSQSAAKSQPRDDKKAEQKQKDNAASIAFEKFEKLHPHADIDGATFKKFFREKNRPPSDLAEYAAYANPKKPEKFQAKPDRVKKTHK